MGVGGFYSVGGDFCSCDGAVGVGDALGIEEEDLGAGGAFDGVFCFDGIECSEKSES